ncbi:hypothetical protein RFI_30713 [Reticulomyxa filosa]|uniref:Uncharacterized protein n=1 Tax=Reticulomyxa filosa TaxID=46433 RepID=X6LYG8_RETFI|nr:hypothetical protein RFI_30713 [Reticulomyxa filosa]|eukprot:ETO06679.1 hypothetical protein RFI_30713 [Reticulomyxa filosa]
MINRGIRKTVPKEESDIQSQITDAGVDSKCKSENEKIILDRHNKKHYLGYVYKNDNYDNCNIRVIDQSNKNDMIIIYMICIESRVGLLIAYHRFVYMEIDKIDDTNKLFNIKIHKMITASSFKHAMIKLLKISKHVLVLNNNENQMPFYACLKDYMTNNDEKLYNMIYMMICKQIEN